MIQKVGLVIPESAEKMMDGGKLVRTNGVLRNAETMEIFKHLQVVDLDESCWKELGDAVQRVIEENKELLAIIGGVIVVSTTTIVLWNHHKKKKQKELEERCNAWLNKAIKDYLAAASKGELDMNIIATCEEALKCLPALTDKIFISLTKEQILEFSANLREYTEKLAEINDYEIEDENVLDDTSHMVAFMLNNLRIQRNILCAA